MMYMLARMTWGMDIVDGDIVNGALYSAVMKAMGETSSMIIHDLIPSTTKTLSLDGANLPNGASMKN